MMGSGCCQGTTLLDAGPPPYWLTHCCCWGQPLLCCLLHVQTCNRRWRGSRAQDSALNAVVHLCSGEDWGGWRMRGLGISSRRQISCLVGYSHWLSSCLSTLHTHTIRQEVNQVRPAKLGKDCADVCFTDIISDLLMYHWYYHTVNPVFYQYFIVSDDMWYHISGT